MFEENIFGLVKQKELLQIGYDVTRQNEPADQLFGDIKTDNLMAYWETMSSQYNLPVMAQYHAFDTVTQKTMRRPIDAKNIEKGLIKSKIATSERLQALVRENDGFRISEEDLKLRGPGDFFGSRQHGLPTLHIADLASSLDVLKEAQEEAARLLRADPGLEGHPDLKARVAQVVRGAENS